MPATSPLHRRYATIASHFLFVRELAHCWNALTASAGIEKVRAPARVVTVSVRPRDICSAR